MPDVQNNDPVSNRRSRAQQVRIAQQMLQALSERASPDILSAVDWMAVRREARATERPTYMIDLAVQRYADRYRLAAKMYPGESRAFHRRHALKLMEMFHPGECGALLYCRSMLRIQDDNHDEINPVLSYGMQHYPDHIGPEYPRGMLDKIQHVQYF